MSASRQRSIVVSAAGWVLVALAAYAAVLVLPYRFPLRAPVFSDNWIVGANNQAAAVALAALSVVVVLMVAVRGRATPRHARRAEPRQSRLLLLLAIVVAMGWTALLGSSVARADVSWGDETYFLSQLTAGLVYHLPIYKGFEFAYGPLLYLWPAAVIRALAPLGISMTAAYLLSLALAQAAGLALLFFVVAELPIRRSLRSAAFLLLAIGTLNSLLGLNYSMLRFVLPYAAVALLARQRSAGRAAVLALGAAFLLPEVSPELGLAFTSAAVCLALYRVSLGERRWLLVVLAAPLGAAVFAVTIGPDFFRTLANMSRGGYNLLLSPAPHVLLLVFAVVVLAPLAVGQAVQTREPRAGLLLGIYVAALGLLPAAIGRGDPIHVFFNGLGWWLLAFVTLDARSARVRNLCLAAIVAVFAFTQVKNFHIYAQRISLMAGGTPAMLGLPNGGFDEAKLLAALGGAQVTVPPSVPPSIVRDLVARGEYLPGFYSGGDGVWDPPAMRRVIADMRRAPFVLVAAGFSTPPAPDTAAERRRTALMRLELAGRGPLHPAYDDGELLRAELAANWTPAGDFGDFVLYRRLR